MRRIYHQLLWALVAMAWATPTAFAGSGPDVIVGGTGEGGGSFTDIVTWGAFGGIRAYSFSTTSCNIGNEVLDWYNCGDGPAFCTLHPVIAQNLFRLHDGRFEQIGQSWLKHGFCALSENFCGLGCSATDCNTLGIGCSDPYTSGLNGTQSNLGPKSDVNATTGEFQYPIPFFSTGNGNIRGRLQVAESDLDPNNFPGARYYVEGHYVAADDHAAGNSRNNASHRRVSFSGATFSPSFPDGPNSTEREFPAIYAWKNDPVNGNPNVTIRNVAVLDNGIFSFFYLAYLVTDNGDGTWRYEFALHNLNVHRSAWSFSIPIQTGLNVTNVGFHDVDYHSGEPHLGTDWSMTVGPNSINWESEAHNGGNDLTANALRWGTLYNFRFDANAAPVNGNATIGLFRPGAAADPTPLVSVPGEPIVPTLPGDANEDGVVDGGDAYTLTLMAIGQLPPNANADLAPPAGVGMEDVCEFVKIVLNKPSCD